MLERSKTEACGCTPFAEMTPGEAANLRGSKIGCCQTRTVQSRKAFLWGHRKVVSSVCGLWWVAAVGSGWVFLGEAQNGDF